MGKQSIELAKWIKSAELINKSALCKEVGIDRGNFDKYLQRGEIPEKFVAKLSLALLKYGYKNDVVKKVVQDVANFGIGIYHQSDEGKITHVSPTSNEAEILKQIADIRAEKIPKERDTPLGRPFWYQEQKEKISKLQQQLK